MAHPWTRLKSTRRERAPVFYSFGLLVSREELLSDPQKHRCLDWDGCSEACGVTLGLGVLKHAERSALEIAPN